MKKFRFKEGSKVTTKCCGIWGKVIEIDEANDWERYFVAYNDERADWFAESDLLSGWRKCKKHIGCGADKLFLYEKCTNWMKSTNSNTNYGG